MGLIENLMQLEEKLDSVLFGDVREQVRGTVKRTLDTSWFTGQSPDVKPPIYNRDYAVNRKAYDAEMPKANKLAKRYHRRFIKPHHVRRNADLAKAFRKMVKSR